MAKKKKRKKKKREGIMACIFAILTCIYMDFDLQQVFEASPPKNLIFM